MSCGASKKSVMSTTSMTDSITTDASYNQILEKLIETSTEENGKITITEIDFFPELAPVLNLPERKVAEDSTGKQAELQSSKVDIKNVGKVCGSVKSVKQTVIESRTKEDTKVEEREQDHKTESISDLTHYANTEEQKTVPVPDPYRWRYVFYIILIIAIGLIYIKRVPIVNWIRKMFAGKFKV